MLAPPELPEWLPPAAAEYIKSIVTRSAVQTKQEFCTASPQTSA